MSVALATRPARGWKEHQLLSAHQHCRRDPARTTRTELHVLSVALVGSGGPLGGTGSRGRGGLHRYVQRAIFRRQESSFSKAYRAPFSAAGQSLSGQKSSFGSATFRCKALEENLEKVTKLPAALAYGLIHRGAGGIRRRIM